MATMFEATLTKSKFPHVLLIAGLVFVLVGVAILLEPMVLVWLMAIVSILIGCIVLGMAFMFRRMTAAFLGATGT